MSLNCQSFVNQFAKLPPQSHTLSRVVRNLYQTSDNKVVGIPLTAAFAHADHMGEFPIPSEWRLTQRQASIRQQALLKG